MPFTDHITYRVSTVETINTKFNMKFLAGLLVAAVCIAAEPISLVDYRVGGLIPHAFPTTNTVPIVKPDGFLEDTPEVIAAKHLHFAELEAAKARTLSPIVPIVPPITPLAPIDYRYLSPIVHSPVPVVSRDGYLIDTPEVAAEKARHFAEVAKAKARIGYPYLF